MMNGEEREIGEQIKEREQKGTVVEVITKRKHMKNG